jgi:transcriptional regulator with XRE-family HTH domain
MPPATILTFSAVTRRAPDSFPNRLHALRKERGWTLAELGARAGFNAAHVQKLETGGRELSKPVMERLARELGVPEADLLASADGGLSRGERALVEAYRRAPEPLRAAFDALAASQAPGEVIVLDDRRTA